MVDPWSLAPGTPQILFCPGVPSGGFRGVPAGGFGSSESTQVSQAQASAASRSAANEKMGKGFSDGLRGAFSKSQSPGSQGSSATSASDRARTPNGTSNYSSNSSSYTATSNGIGGHSAPSASSGSRSAGFGGRSSGYGESSGSRYSGMGGSNSGYGGARGVPAGGFGKSGVPAGGFGANQGVPAAGRPGVQAGGFGGVADSAQASRLMPRAGSSSSHSPGSERLESAATSDLADLGRTKSGATERRGLGPPAARPSPALPGSEASAAEAERLCEKAPPHSETFRDSEMSSLSLRRRVSCKLRRGLRRRSRCVGMSLRTEDRSVPHEPRRRRNLLAETLNTATANM